MAYRRRRTTSTRRRSYSGTRSYRSRSRSTGRRGRSTSGRNTLRIVIEQPTMSQVARPLGTKPAPAAKRSKF